MLEAGAHPRVPTSGPLLQPGINCWKVARASRAAFVVDGAAYFEAVAEALERAQHTILIVGWDIDARVRLRRDRPGETLGAVLAACVRARPGLSAWVLGWDFSPIYLFERDALGRLRFAVDMPANVHHRLDDHHPAGGSQHEKLLVIDDCVAFCGGLDLCDVRWDTPEHTAGDPRRVDLAGKWYRPHHDVVMAVEGDAAAALGELVRERWRDATDKVPPAVDGCSDCWPPVLRVDVHDVDVGIARTRPAIDGRPEIREVERLWLDALAAADADIYIENPYLTSRSVTDALRHRLGSPDAPQTVVVIPQEGSGWMEDVTVGVLREQSIAATRAADVHGRLRIVSPLLPALAPGLPPVSLNLHGKVCIVDDRFVRIGSANLTNRSMGLDGECDLAIDAGDRPDVRAAIRGLRSRLLGEHLGRAPELVEQACATRGLVATVDRMGGDDRTLAPYRPERSPLAEQMLPPATFVDPDRPLDARQIGAWLLTGRGEGGRARRWQLAAIAWWVVFAVAVVVARATDLLDAGMLDAVLGLGQGHPLLASLIVIATFVIGGLALVPVTVMIAGCGAVFGPWLGTAFGLLGAFAGAAAYHWLGTRVGRPLLDRIAGHRVRHVLHSVASRGFLAVAIVRVLPLAPHVVVGLAAGAARISFTSYMLATALVMTPGAIALVLVGHQLGAGGIDGWELGVATLALVLACVVVASLARRWISGSLRSARR